MGQPVEQRRTVAGVHFHHGEAVGGLVVHQHARAHVDDLHGLQAAGVVLAVGDGALLGELVLDDGQRGRSLGVHLGALGPQGGAHADHGDRSREGCQLRLYQGFHGGMLGEVGKLESAHATRGYLERNLVNFIAFFGIIGRFCQEKK